MFKKFKIMMIVLTCLSQVYDLQASLQVAIAARDFCVGNSLVLIARDGNGCEKVAGYVSFDDGKTEFSQAEISAHHPTMLSITQQTIALQKSMIVADVKQDQIEQNDEGLIYLYFHVDPTIKIVRVLVIKNNLLADNPFDVLEFSTTSMLDDEDDEDDDFCFDEQNDELSRFNLTDLQDVEAVQLSNYDKMILGFYALWAVQSAQVKQTYKNFTAWFASERHAK